MSYTANGLNPADFRERREEDARGKSVAWPRHFFNVCRPGFRQKTYLVQSATPCITLVSSQQIVQYAFNYIINYQ